MSDTLYLLANASVLPVWLLLVFAPRASITEKLARTPAVPAAYAVIYVALLLGTSYIGGDGDMGSMSGLRTAFARDYVLLLAWVHYLCFDMAVGMWEFRDARRLGLRWRFVGPCLVLTLFFGPTGFLLYCLLRYLRTGTTSWDVPAATTDGR